MRSLWKFPEVKGSASHIRREKAAPLSKSLRCILWLLALQTQNLGGQLILVDPLQTAVKLTGLKNAGRMPVFSFVIGNMTTTSDTRGCLRTFSLCIHTTNKARSEWELLEDHVPKTKGFYGSRRDPRCVPVQQDAKQGIRVVPCWGLSTLSLVHCPNLASKTPFLLCVSRTLY